MQPEYAEPTSQSLKHGGICFNSSDRTMNNLSSLPRVSMLGVSPSCASESQLLVGPKKDAMALSNTTHHTPIAGCSSIGQQVAAVPNKSNRNIVPSYPQGGTAESSSLSAGSTSTTSTTSAFLLGINNYKALENVDLPSFVKEHQATLTFPEKLMLMLTFVDKEFGTNPMKLESAPVSWILEGRAFIIRNKDKLVKDLLPLFFRQAKFASFTRKLYRWGFRQVSITPERISQHQRREMIFGHEYFQRDNKPLMARMRSVTAAGNRRALAAMAQKQQKSLEQQQTSLVPSSEQTNKAIVPPSLDPTKMSLLMMMNRSNNQQQQQQTTASSPAASPSANSTPQNPQDGSGIVNPPHQQPSSSSLPGLHLLHQHLNASSNQCFAAVAAAAVAAANLQKQQQQPPPLQSATTSSHVGSPSTGANNNNNNGTAITTTKSGHPMQTTTSPVASPNNNKGAVPPSCFPETTTSGTNKHHVLAADKSATTATTNCAAGGAMMRFAPVSGSQSTNPTLQEALSLSHEQRALLTQNLTVAAHAAAAAAVAIATAHQQQQAAALPPQTTATGVVSAHPQTPQCQEQGVTTAVTPTKDTTAEASKNASAPTTSLSPFAAPPGASAPAATGVCFPQQLTSAMFNPATLAAAAAQHFHELQQRQQQQQCAPGMTLAGQQQQQQQGENGGTGGGPDPNAYMRASIDMLLRYASP